MKLRKQAKLLESYYYCQRTGLTGQGDMRANQARLGDGCIDAPWEVPPTVRLRTVPFMVRYKEVSVSKNTRQTVLLKN